MCVRVIRGVVNCRLDYKQFVLWYCSVPKVTVHAVFVQNGIQFLQYDSALHAVFVQNGIQFLQYDSAWQIESHDITQQLPSMFVS